MAHRNLLFLLLSLIFSRSDLGAQSELRLAERLTQEATAAWGAGDHETAVEKLSEVDRIYREHSGRHEALRAGILRARIFNLVRLGRLADARKDFDAIFTLRDADPRAGRELMVAYGAFYSQTSSLRDWKEIQARLRPLREQARKRKAPLLSAQILHDLGTLASRLPGDREGFGLLVAAAEERAGIGDFVGQAWSLNNAGWDRLQQRDGSRAFQLLIKAHGIVHERGARGPLSMVAGNLLRCIDGTKSKEERRSQAPQLWKAAETSARSTNPRVIPITRLALAALGSDPSAAGIERFLALRAKDEPLPQRALRLVQGALILESGDAIAIFRASLDGLLKAKNGPLDPHLHALIAIAWVHLCALEGDSPPDLVSRATKAIADLESSGDRGAQERAFAIVESSARTLELGNELGALLKAAKTFRRIPRRRPLPGIVVDQPDRSVPSNHQLSDPLFSFHAIDGRLTLQDEATKEKRDIELRWQPRLIAFNGLRLTLHGDTVILHGLRYGTPNRLPASPVRLDSFEQHSALIIGSKPQRVFMDGSVR